MASTDEYAVFKKFSNIEQATELMALLKDHNVDHQLVDNSPAIDITFSGNTLQNEVQILIKQSDFDMANELLEKQAENLIDQVDKNHYLFDFTNEELYEILMKPDEWSAFDYKLTQKILNDKGQPVDQDLIKTLRKQRIEDMAQPEQGQKPWIYLGYFFAIFGGLIGLFIGRYLWTYKKTLPDGRKVNAYSKSDQRHGHTIFIIGIVCFVIWLTIRLKISL